MPSYHLNHQFASDLGFRIAKNLIGGYKKNTFMKNGINFLNMCNITSVCTRIRYLLMIELYFWQCWNVIVSNL